MTQRFLKGLFGALVLTASTGGLANAGDLENTIIETVTKGYGGKAFTNIKTLSLTSDLRFGWIGQGFTDSFVELEPMTKILSFDFQNEKASEEAWGARGGYLEHVVSTKEGQINADLLSKTYTVDKEADWYSHFGGEIRTSSLLLALDMVKNKDSLKFIGNENYRGAPHYVVTYDMPGTSLDPVIWINQNSGHITLMQRDVPNVYKLSLVFDNFKSERGVTYADDFIFYVDDNIIEYAKSRSLRVNKVKPKTFVIDKDVKPAPASANNDELSVDEITDGIYHVGQGGAYSVFVDAGDHYIAAGGYGGLKNRYDELVKTAGQKPLLSVVMTHFHSDHVGGVADALKLGATIYAPGDALKNLEAANGGPIPDGKFKEISGAKTVLGRMELHKIAVPHASEYALVYIPKGKTIFQEDLHQSNFTEQASKVDHQGMALKAEIDRLGLDVDYIAGAHARNIETWANFKKMADNFVPGTCPTGRKICRGTFY